VPLDRLRKEAAYQRLLARLVEVAPPDMWALKGGLAMIARVGRDARATRDADTTWRGEGDLLAAALEAVVDLDLEDHFVFEIGEPRPITAESPDGELRYSVVARLDGREFERLQLDVNLVPDDPRPVEIVQLRGLLDFAGMPAPAVPMVDVGQHLAEKLHAYARDHGEAANSRARDLFDMLVLAEHVPVAELTRLRHARKVTFELRSTPWPPVLPAPPAAWEPAWRGFVADHNLRWGHLDDAHAALAAFWQDVLHDASGHREWDPVSWRWEGR